MSDRCYECNQAEPVFPCDTCHPPSLPIRERVEEYLTENGWTQRDLFWSLDGFDLDGMLPMRLGHALDIQLARDASKEESK